MRKGVFHDSIRFSPIWTLKFPNIHVFTASENWAAICESYSDFVNIYDIGIVVVATCYSIQTCCKGLLAKSWLFFSPPVSFFVFICTNHLALSCFNKKPGWAHPQNELPFFPWATDEIMSSHRWSEVYTSVEYLIMTSGQGLTASFKTQL